MIIGTANNFTSINMPNEPRRYTYPITRGILSLYLVIRSGLGNLKVGINLGMYFLPLVSYHVLNVVYDL